MANDTPEPKLKPAGFDEHLASAIVTGKPIPVALKAEPFLVRVLGRLEDDPTLLLVEVDRKRYVLPLELISTLGGLKPVDNLLPETNTSTEVRARSVSTKPTIGVLDSKMRHMGPKLECVELLVGRVSKPMG